jgi:DNA topoisomerase-3
MMLERYTRRIEMAHEITVMLAEKPSVATCLGEYLSKRDKLPMRKQRGFIEVGENIKITYPRGHILEQEMPEAYIAEENRRRKFFEIGPFIPPDDGWKLRVRSEVTEADLAKKKRDPKYRIPYRPDPHFNVVKGLLKTAKKIVNAGDIEREGQLIMDELFIYLNIDPTAKHISRLAVSDLSDDGLNKAFATVTQNGDPRWVAMREAATARQHADWLVGMNVSRAVASLTGLINASAGRVKSCVLNMVIRRDREIASFVPVPYFTPIVVLRDGLEMVWKARAGAEGTHGFDESGKIISRDVAEAIVKAINSNAVRGHFSDVKSNKKSTPPPLGYSLVKLQQEASKKLGIPVSEVTKAAQSLYDKKAMSYVGTDCEYYTPSTWSEAHELMETLSPAFRQLMEGADHTRHSAAFDPAKQGEHSALTPTKEPPNMASLTKEERGVYDMVVRRFAAQFYGDYQYQSQSIKASFADDSFEATAVKTLDPGWKVAENEHFGTTLADTAAGAELKDDESETESDEEREST